eukprot:TRINITY_DN46_c0_g1_i1.p1 TRINITY_DN46_c0_g1~~TRINITY_DN46_c0_g1_i1.p1  ORF type:complete len:421 (+),score=100.90 TRINITY_DN46_c0_g1_i1:39-1301(+)
MNRISVVVVLCALLAICCPAAARSTNDQVVANIAESIPVGMEDLKPQMTTVDAWLWLINSAQRTLDLAEFYFELTDGEFWPAHDGGWMGVQVDAALRAAAARGVEIRLVLNEPSDSMNDTEAFILEHAGVMTVRNISWSDMFPGGILHTKLMIADRTNAYIGSANAGWTSLSQVKELGVLLQNAPTMAQDVGKVFDQYWEIAGSDKLPSPWPLQYDTTFNVQTPGTASVNGNDALWYISSTPDGMCPAHRTWNLQAIQASMAAAKKTICVSVMDYLPVTQFANPNVYFPEIDTAIRAAAFAGVQVKMMISKWNHSSSDMWQYLYSLNDLENVEVQIFEVPALPDQNQIPFTRVNHAKFMVTDSVAYISTQNWSGDYFLNTGGVAIAIEQPEFVASLQAVFDRDWTSQYTSPLPPAPPKPF